MKKTEILILVIAICLGIFLLHKSSDSILLGDESDILGDVDGNKVVGMNDYMLIKKHLLNIEKLTGAKLSRADVDGNGSIGMGDYMAVKKILLGMDISYLLKVDFTANIDVCEKATITAVVPNTIQAVSYSLDNVNWTTSKTFEVNTNREYRVYVKDQNGEVYNSEKKEVNVVPKSLLNGEIIASDVGLKTGKGTMDEAVNNSVILNKILYCAHNNHITNLKLQPGNYYLGPVKKGVYDYGTFTGQEFIKISIPKVVLDLKDTTLYVYPNNLSRYGLIHVELDRKYIPANKTEDKDKFSVTIKNGTLIGDRNEHKCAKGNWTCRINASVQMYGMSCPEDAEPSHQYAHGIRVISNNTTIWRMVIKDMVADGVYIANNGDYLNGKFYFNNSTMVQECHIENNRRNGITIIWGTDITIDKNTIINTHGTLPEVGIDIERNGNTNTYKNVTITNNKIYDNNRIFSIVVHSGVEGTMKIQNNELGGQIVYTSLTQNDINKITVSGNKATTQGKNCVCDPNKPTSVTSTDAAKVVCNKCIEERCNGIFGDVWLEYDKNWYYFNTDGTLAKNKWVQNNGKWYYLKADGKMAAKERIQITYQGQLQWFEFDKDGKCISGSGC